MIFAQVRIPSSAFTEKTTEIVREVVADAPAIFGIGLDTLAGAATGAGGLAAVMGAVKLAGVVMRKNRKEEPVVDTTTKRPAGNDPFPRQLEQARQQRELRQYTERRCPEYDAAVGRILQDEITVQRQTATADEIKTLEQFWLRIRDRVDRMMPPSTREYLE